MAERIIVYAANAGSSEVSIFHLEHPSGKLRPLGSATTGGPASSMAVSPDGRFLHVSVKSDPPSVETFAIDRASGGLSPVAHAAAPASLTFITMDANGWFILGAAYHSHIACVMTVSPEGVPNPQPIAVLEPGIHPHAVRIDAANRFAYIPALGSDCIRQYSFDPLTGVLAPLAPESARTPAGSGPRHFCFSPDGQYVWLLTELSGDVITFRRDQENGQLETASSVSIIPPGDSGEFTMWAADIQVRPDGGFVYASERTTSVITCFKVDPETGRLDYANHTATEKQPRGFALDQSGRYLVAAGEQSHHVSCYGVDAYSGALTLLDRARAGDTPNWVSIVTLSE